MRIRVSNGLAAAALISGVVLAAAGAVAQDFVLRISTENSERHFQTRLVARFAETLAEISAGRITARHLPDARLFNDREVVRALQLGQVEMALPGAWQIDRLVPDLGLFQLPVFYGRDARGIHQVMDGPPGKMISARVQDDLGLVVLGRWIDLGFAHVFGVGRDLRTADDLKGLRIRVAGGQANLWRLERLGARPFVVPWPDLPQALEHRAVDGVLTTYETVASASLWASGLNRVIEDRQYFAHYIPLVSDRFWSRLPTDLRAAMSAAWERHVDEGRAMADEAQREARAAFQRNGGRIATPSDGVLAEARARLRAGQDDLVAVLGLDPALLARVADILESPR